MFRHGFKGLRTDPAEMAVSPDAIIERLDVLGDLGRGDRSSRVDVVLDPLLFQAAKERFRHRVVPAITPSTHARFLGDVPGRSAATHRRPADSRAFHMEISSVQGPEGAGVRRARSLNQSS